ncbi:hypothetical protein SPRG_00575 [Saprolegnia parasitica CBS 223.65]|uniref:RING-type domain-containing protein n=1 Tax=Saprolegnia parasitica (strain CBS 223.65) TaxID=695850 RepID=A0A067D673_SAPPC|nr:hypothetical protein SPRG_00575 [Saprolegnia parasitica CBS 223.65]KDO34512.1 hypothetical protein SPRG_00575 [Saprolegnia parasitica CBS 223.65]|eukprot:XP_012194190.1 hypothetical protein SPRG_00575 [Saprolegnia parasitica CBS 223.65]
MMDVICVDGTSKRIHRTVSLPPEVLGTVLTVRDVAQHLEGSLRLGPCTSSALKLYGQSLHATETLQPYLPALRTSNPRWVFVFTSSPASMTLFIALPTGHLSLQAHPDETIATLKARIRAVSRCPFQRLTLRRRTLWDSRTVGSYGLCNDATLVAELVLCGGGAAAEFVDVANEELCSVLQQSPSAPAWRRFCTGLNVHGVCTNATCVAYHEWVIVPRKFAPFNLLQHQVACPMCASLVVARSVGFFKCLWRFEGVQHPSRMHVSSPWAVVDGNEYMAFDEKSRRVLWLSLVFSVRRNDGSDECAVCCEALCVAPTERVQPCRHEIHTACLSEWKASCIRREAVVNCPTCRAVL